MSTVFVKVEMAGWRMAGVKKALPTHYDREGDSGEGLLSTTC